MPRTVRVLLRPALRTLRVRWVSFVGSFVALSLGVAVVAAVGLNLAAAITAADRPPAWFVDAPAVVRVDEVLRVDGLQAGYDSQPLAERRGVPAELVAALGATGPVVAERSFDARIVDGAPDAGRIGHPWSAARYAPFTLTAGRAPLAADEIVVTGEPLGAHVLVLTSQGPRPYTVVGVVHGRVEHREQTPVFFADTEAARLSPRVDAVVAYGPLAAVRSAAERHGADVLTGVDRAKAEPGRALDRDALADSMILLGMSVGVCGFASIFVVASTFAFHITRRTREFALLRAVGARPGQIRRTVRIEAAVVGALASAVGCALGLVAAPPIGRRLAHEGLAPAWFTVTMSPTTLVIAYTTGLFVALAGVSTAARRAARTSPMAALREATIEPGRITRPRLLSGVVGIGGAVVMIVVAIVTDPASMTNRKTYVPITMLLIAGVALLSPLLVAPTARALTWPLTRLGGPMAVLIRRNALAAAGRTAAIAAPIMVTVGLAACLLGATATGDAAQASLVRNTVRADFVVTTDVPGGLDPATVERVRALPGADTETFVPTTVYAVMGGAVVIAHPAAATDAASWRHLSELPLVAGSLANLDENSIVLDENWDGHAVGDTVRVWLADGLPRTMRVAAIAKADGGTYIHPSLAGAARPDKIYVKARPGTDRTVLRAALTTATTHAAAQVLTTRQWIDAADHGGSRYSRVGIFVVVGIAVLYTSIAIANTLVTATLDRARELALLRLAGADKPHIVRLVAAETLVPIAVGITMAMTAAAAQLLGTWAALRRHVGPTHAVLPLAPVGAVTLMATLIALTAAAIAARIALRTPPVRFASTDE